MPTAAPQNPALLPPPPLPEFLSQRFPFHRHLLPLHRGANAGLRLHLVDHGPERASAGAPTVVLLHGNPTWSFLWRKVMRRLEDFRIVAPDLLGLGLSSHLPRMEDHQLPRHAEAIAEALEVLDVRDAVCVAQDWGGPILTTAASMVPERVRGWVLGNTAVVVPKHPRNTAFHRFARRPVISDLVFRGFGFPQRALHKAQGDPDSIRGDIARAYRWPLDGARLGQEIPDPPDSGKGGGLFPGYRRRVAPLDLARM
ncbi:MAG: alpha/beta fold hydrolase, partial [Acidobacteriota bacterium]|nr:alpha/beta fold hydrolase [Acidobacteriota bacterium]